MMSDNSSDSSAWQMDMITNDRKLVWQREELKRQQMAGCHHLSESHFEEAPQMHFASASLSVKVVLHLTYRLCGAMTQLQQLATSLLMRKKKQSELVVYFLAH